MLQQLRKLERFDLDKGGMSLCRDGHHMHHIYGRYILAYTWARMLLGRPLEDNAYLPQSEYAPDETADQEILKIIRSEIEGFFK